MFFLFLEVGVYCINFPLRTAFAASHRFWEKTVAPHFSTLAWKIPWTEEPGRLQSMGRWRIRHNWATSLSLSCIGEGDGNPLQCSCLENPRDGRAWWAAVCGGAQSQTWLKQLSNSSRGFELPSFHCHLFLGMFYFPLFSSVTCSWFRNIVSSPCVCVFSYFLVIDF